MTDSVQSIETLAKRFFDAIEAGDIAAMRASLADDAAIWHNTDELIVTPDQTAQTLTGMVARITDIHYAGKRHHDGVAVRLPCAIVCRVDGGLITRLDEYFDSAHVATFRKFATS